MMSATLETEGEGSYASPERTEHNTAIAECSAEKENRGSTAVKDRGRNWWKNVKGHKSDKRKRLRNKHVARYAAEVFVFVFGPSERTTERIPTWWGFLIFSPPLIASLCLAFSKTPDKLCALISHKTKPIVTVA